MKINLAIIIALVTVGLGYFFNQPYLWVPVSVLGAGLVDLLTRSWVTSDRLGSSANLSAFIKMIFALIGFYAMLGQLACVALILWWFVF